MAKSGRQSGTGSGGGLGSRNVVRPGVVVGARGREVGPRGVSQIGSAMGNHATETARKLSGAVEAVHRAPQPANGPGGVPLGNAVALNVGKGGCGTGRTLYANLEQIGPTARRLEAHGPRVATPWRASDTTNRRRKLWLR